MLLSEADLLRTPDPVGMGSEDPPWFLWAYSLVGAVLIVLVVMEFLAVVRARRVGEGAGGGGGPTGSGWGGIGAAAVALSVVAVPMSSLA